MTINNSSKYFPIRNSAACPLKWNWNTLWLYEGAASSCCVSAKEPISADTFEQFHNGDKKLQHRKLMLQGTWPDDECDSCRLPEQQGEFSNRLIHLDIPNQIPVELEQNSEAVTVTPTTLEVYFNNTCNLSCLYCTPTLSSKINQEYQKYGDFIKDGISLKATTITTEYDRMVEKFWAWLEQNSIKLRRLNILGGEPLYQNDFYKTLDWFESKCHPELELTIITNLMVPADRHKKVVDRFQQLLAKKKLKRIDITCSIDCWGAEQEYVRHGLDLDHWIKNFEYLLSKKWLTLHINQAINVLGIKTMPVLIEKLSQWRQQRPVGHYFSSVVAPTYLSPFILGNSIFDADFKKIINSMSKETLEQQNAKSYMNSIYKQLQNSQPNLTEMQKLKIYLDENDRRKNTNWAETFPWLVKELQHVVQ